MLSTLISTLVRILIGWILIEKVPAWLGLTKFFATIVRILGIIIIISALLIWV